MSAAPLPRPIRPTSGFVQDPRNAFDHWPRLLAGETQWSLLKFIQHEEQFKTKDRWTRAISKEEMAEYCRCTVRAVEMTLNELVTRKVIQRKKTAQGFAYSIPFETWPELPDRPPKVVPISNPEEAEEESEEEAKKPRGEQIQICTAQKLRAGGRSRRKELPVAAGHFQFEAETEIEFDARMCDGVLIVRGRAGETKANSTGTKGEGKRNEFRKTEDKSQSNQQKSLSNFHLLEQAYLNENINFAPDDWSASRVIWSQMEIAEQLAAVAGVKERFYLGEYDLKETKWIPLPQNYLQKKLWMRPIRGKQKEKAKVFTDQAGTDALMDWARERDRARKAAKK